MTHTPPVHNFSLFGREISFNPEYVMPEDYDKVHGHTLPVVSVALDISGSCNLRCLYCAESGTLPQRRPMSEGILKRSLDFVFSQAPENCAVSVHLGSGEPLLQPSMVELIGEISRQKERESKRPVDLHITTNGTLLTEGIITHLDSYGWNVKVSIDGPPEIHDRYRTDTSGNPTFSRVSQGIRQLLTLMPVTLSTTSVLCHGTDPSAVFYSIAEMGVKQIELVPISLKGGSDLKLDETDLAAYRNFITEYARRLARGEDLPVNIRFKKRLLRALGFFNTSIACDAGRNFIAVGPDGTLYPCFRFVGLQEYAVGHLHSGGPNARRGEFIGTAGRPYQDRDCIHCWAAPLCGGPCFAVTELMCNGRTDPIYCSIVRAEAEAALYLAEEVREKSPERLLALAGIPAVFDEEGPAG